VSDKSRWSVRIEVEADDVPDALDRVLAICEDASIPAIMLTQSIRKESDD